MGDSGGRGGLGWQPRRINIPTPEIKSERTKRREFKKQFRQVNRIIFSVIYMAIGAGIYHNYQIRSWDGFFTLLVIGLWFMKTEWSFK